MKNTLWPFIQNINALPDDEADDAEQKEHHAP